MKLLVWGGNGYIGSHTVLGLLVNGHDVVIADDLASRYRNTLPPNAVFYKGDCRDKRSLSAFLKKEKVDAVIYCATLFPIEQRDANPLKYYENHIYDIKLLLNVMFENHVDKIIFSAVVSADAEADDIAVPENNVICSENLYCKTKLAMEKMIALSCQIYKLHYIILRLLNFHGEKIDSTTEYMRTAEKQLYETAEKNCRLDSMYRTGYDGTDRDTGSEELQVNDIGRIHIMAVEYLMNGGRNNIIDFKTAQNI